MKKLLILSLLSTMAFGAKDNFKSTMKDIGGQFAEAVMTPIHAVKNVIVDNEIDKDFVDVVSAYPKFFVEQAEDVKDFTKETAQKVADSKFVAKVKKATDKAVTKTKKAATKAKNATVRAYDNVKEATVKAGNHVKDAAIKTGDAIKDAADKVAKSEAVEDIKDVGHQLFVDAPIQFWAAIKAAGKAIKAEFAD